MPTPNAADAATPRRAPAPLRWAMRLQVALYRRTGGHVPRRVAGAPVLLLTTTGRRSGTPHTVPLGYFELEGARYVVAPNAGTPRDPAWYRNLLARPEVTVELGRFRYPAVATPATGAERARLWEHAVAVAPPYGKFARGPREIPVVVLRPAS